MRIGTLELNKAVAQQVAEELSYACGQIDNSEWLKILYTSAWRASKEAAFSKYCQFRKLGNLFISTGKRYRRDGIYESLCNDAICVKNYAFSVPRRIKDFIDKFKQMSSSQQSDQVVDMVLTWIIFWASAGGSDLEGGLPDLDLAFGIGNHRNLFTHTILLGLGSEIALRMRVDVFCKIHSKLPTNHLRAWDSAHAFIQKHKQSSINALWAGIGAHFLKDANLFSDATKPYIGLPDSMPMGMHQMLFAANGAACEAVAFVRD